MSIPTMDSLPGAPQDWVNEMKREADKKMQQDGISQEMGEAQITHFDQTENQESDVNQTEEVAQPHIEQASQKESVQAQNFKAVREAKEKAERERDELIRMYRDLESKVSQASQPEEDLEFSIAPDELAEGKHLNKVQKKIKSQEEQLRAYHHKLKEMEINLKIKEQFDDYNKVMTHENINKLETLHPEIAAVLIASNNTYAARVSTYQFIKKLGIVKDEDLDMDKQKVQVNSFKPRPLASVSSQQGTSPLTRANAFENGLTEELAAQLRKEMVQAMKNR